MIPYKKAHIVINLLTIEEILYYIGINMTDLTEFNRINSKITE